MDYIEQFSALLECNSEELWHKIILDLVNKLGFEHMLLAIFPDKGKPIEASFAFLHSNYSPEWRDKYDAENLGYIDPTVTHSTTKMTPLIWSSELFSTLRQKEMYEEACMYGLRSGITLPIHGPNHEFGLLCLADDMKSHKDFLQHAIHLMPDVSYLRDIIFESSTQFRQPAIQPTYPKLTPCELECLKWSASGKSSWEIANILCCSEPTVDFHIKNIRQKLDVTTRRHAIVKAIILGFISPA